MTADEKRRDEIIWVRTTKADKERLQAAAARHRRSMAAQAEVVLIGWLDREQI